MQAKMAKIRGTSLMDVPEVNVKQSRAVLWEQIINKLVVEPCFNKSKNSEPPQMKRTKAFFSVIGFLILIGNVKLY